jgi:hypothetical protein
MLARKPVSAAVLGSEHRKDAADDGHDAFSLAPGGVRM